MGSGSSCCPKCGTTYEGIGGGPKAVAATGKPAAVLPAALESPEAALAALKEMVGSGQCKLAEAPKAKDPYNAAVHELAAASTAAQKAANQLKHHRLLLRQAEEKVANLGRKVAEYVAECSVLDEAARKAQVVFDALDSELKAGPVAAQVEPGADVLMGDSDRMEKIEAMCRMLMEERNQLRDELKRLSEKQMPLQVPEQVLAAPAAAPVRQARPALDGLWAAASAEPATAKVFGHELPLSMLPGQTPAGPVFEAGWAASATGAAPLATAAAAAPAPAPGTAHKRGSDGGSDASGRSRASRRARGTLGGSQERAAGDTGPIKEVTAEEAVKMAADAREACRSAIADDAADAARLPASG